MAINNERHSQSKCFATNGIQEGKVNQRVIFEVVPVVFFACASDFCAKFLLNISVCCKQVKSPSKSVGRGVRSGQS